MHFGRKKAHFFTTPLPISGSGFALPALGLVFRPKSKLSGSVIKGTRKFANSQLHVGQGGSRQPMRPNRSKRIPVRTAAVLLLFAVAGMAMAAKHGQYLPKSDPLHHLSKATKMELLHHPAEFVAAATVTVCRVVPPRPEFSATLLIQPEGIVLHQSDLAVSSRHRAPPALLA